MTRRLSVLVFVLLTACPSTPAPEDVGTGGDAPDAPGLDVPGACAITEAECGGSCIDVQEDEANCGGCGVACAADEACFFGVCQPATCPAGSERCQGACVDTAVDASHCGACDHACADGEVCEAGSCVSACPAPNTVCENEGVSVCTDTRSDPDHCGACGMRCPAGMGCSGGTCACRGRAVEMCGETCVDTTRDYDNCGGCGIECIRGACSSGVCTCRAGATLCGTECVATATDNRNCGVCGRVCARGSNCVGGTCVASSCPTSQTLCGGTCVDITTDEANCGGCGVTCPSGTTCTAGTCPPPNDDRANASVIVPSLSEVTVMGTTVGASFDGTAVPCACSSARNVWYRFELTGSSIVYFDTFGSGATDTALHITDAAGVPLITGLPWTWPATLGACNDDASCTGTGWDGGASRTTAILDPGTWYVAVGSCNPGTFTLHMQTVPTSIAEYVYGVPMASGGTSITNRLPTGSASAPTCGGGTSGEAMHWFLSCGEDDVLLSLCRSDGGRWERNDDLFGPFRDPVMTVRSGATGTDLACVDDAGGPGTGVDCRGLTLRINPILLAPQFFVDARHYGPRFSGAVSRGVTAVVIDEAASAGGLEYRLVYDPTP